MKHLLRLFTGEAKNFLGLVIVVVIVVFVSSCKQGDTGPVGPQGAKGNANVKVDTFTVTNANWLWNSDYTLYTGSGSSTSWFTRYTDKIDSTITSGILDSGMVLVFFTPNDSAQWAPLPYSFPSFGDAFYYNFVFQTMVGKVRLHIFFNGVDATSTIPTLSTYTFPNYKFKIVIVAGTLKAKMQYLGIDTMNHEAVMNFLQRSKNSIE